MTKMLPVDKQTRVALRNAVQPPQASPAVAFVLLVLLAQPGAKSLIEVHEQFPHFCRIEPPIVSPPAIEDWIETMLRCLPTEVVHALANATI